MEPKNLEKVEYLIYRTNDMINEAASYARESNILKSTLLGIVDCRLKNIYEHAVKYEKIPSYYKNEMSATQNDLKNLKSSVKSNTNLFKSISKFEEAIGYLCSGLTSANLIDPEPEKQAKAPMFKTDGYTYFYTYPSRGLELNPEAAIPVNRQEPVREVINTESAPAAAPDRTFLVDTNDLGPLDEDRNDDDDIF